MSKFFNTRFKKNYTGLCPVCNALLNDCSDIIGVINNKCSNCGTVYEYNAIENTISYVARIHQSDEAKYN